LLLSLWKIKEFFPSIASKFIASASLRMSELFFFLSLRFSYTEEQKALPLQDIAFPSFSLKIQSEEAEAKRKKESFAAKILEEEGGKEGKRKDARRNQARPSEWYSSHDKFIFAVMKKYAAPCWLAGREWFAWTFAPPKPEFLAIFCRKKLT
jgi:hypothetical protein